MPAGKEASAGDGGGSGGGAGAKNAAGRTTFRPPWVKEGPKPLPPAAAPWTLKSVRRNSNNTAAEPEPAIPAVQLRKTPVQNKVVKESSPEPKVPKLRKTQTKIKPAEEEEPPEPKVPKLRKTQTKIKPAEEEEPPEPKVPQLRKTPVQNKEAQENGTVKKKDTFVRPQLKPVPPKEDAPRRNSSELKIPVKLNVVKDSPIKAEPKQYSNRILPDEEGTIEKATPAKRNALVRAESMRRVSNTPQAPPMPPPAPALPKLIESTNLNEKQLAKIEQLKARPKVRPDWAGMLKEIEANKKLKHVQCNDRSQPLLPQAKAKGQFLYESEKDAPHNELLKQIQTGVLLKKTKTNDRSKPNLEGLRKFRRQMTIEEQIIKSQSMASMPPEEITPEEVDEMDDIDKVRDDLQSTKQMLALELRNKEAQIRENKRLQARIQNLEAELEKAKSEPKKEGGKPSSQADEKVIKSLKTEAEQARKASEEVEKKYHEAADKLDVTKNELDEAKKQNQLLEKRLQEALQGKRMSICDRKGSVNKEDEESDYAVEESDEDEGLDEEQKKEKRAQREVKMLANKLRSYKTKEDNAKKERVALKTMMKNIQNAMKEEKKKYKSLQKEVDKMAKLMKESSEDEDEDEEEEEEEEEKEDSESESESSESESEESDSDDSASERSMSEPEDAPLDKKKDNLTKRGTRHENILGALKKGNFMLKANVERLQDELNKQKEMTLALQEDLDSVLAELG